MGGPERPSCTLAALARHEALRVPRPRRSHHIGLEVRDVREGDGVKPPHQRFNRIDVYQEVEA